MQFAGTKDTSILFFSSTPSTVAVHCDLNLSKMTRHAWSSGQPNSFLFCFMQGKRIHQGTEVLCTHLLSDYRYMLHTSQKESLF